MITIGSDWWKLLISTILSYFRRFWAFGGLTGFLRWLSNIHFPRFFFVYIFKRKLLNNYRSLEKKLCKFRKSRCLEPFLANHDYDLLKLVKIVDFQRGHPLEIIPSGYPKLFLREWWPEIVRGQPYKNSRWHEVFSAKQDQKSWNPKKGYFKDWLYFEVRISSYFSSPPDHKRKLMFW